MNEQSLLQRITVNTQIFGGKPMMCSHPITVEYVLGMLAAGDAVETIIAAYPWIESEDIQACLICAY
jgi:uncharacterized protein (DUF433 family)